MTGSGHCATPSPGSVSGEPEALGLAPRLALGLALGDALVLGDALLLGGEFAVGRTVGDDVGVALLEAASLALGSGEAVTLGSTDAVSSFDGEIDGSMATVRASSDADCEALGDGSSTADVEGDEVELTRGVAVAGEVLLALGLSLALAVPVALGLSLALAVPVALALALAEGSITGSRFASASGSQRSGMPSDASSESVDASAGVVLTSDATIAMLDAATTMRRTRVARDIALTDTMFLTPDTRNADLGTGRHQAPKMFAGPSRVSVIPSRKDKLSRAISCPQNEVLARHRRRQNCQKSQVDFANPQVLVEGHSIPLTKSRVSSC